MPTASDAREFARYAAAWLVGTGADSPHPSFRNSYLAGLLTEIAEGATSIQQATRILRARVSRQER